MKKVFNAIWVFMALIILNPTANAQSEVCTDFDDDGVVGYSDFFLFRDAFNSMQGDANWNARFDLKADGIINFADFLQFAKYFGKGCEGQTDKFTVGENCKEVFPWHNGPVNERVNLVFMPFNYENIEGFLGKVKTLVDINNIDNSFFSVEPLKSNKNKFNLWYVNQLEYEPESSTLVGGLPLKNPSFYQYGKWTDTLKKCGGIPPLLKVGVVMLDGNFVIAGVYPSNKEESGFVGGLIVPNNPIIREFQHDFMHAFAGLGDEYTGPGAVMSTSYENCDIATAEVACPKWCKGSPIPVETFISKDCLNLDLDGCVHAMEDGSPCYLIQTNGPIGKAGSCINIIKFCTSINEEAKCKDTTNNFYLNPICSWSNKKHPYYKSNCIPDENRLNIGAQCVGGTGCYHGCGGDRGIFRSEKYGAMMRAGLPLGVYNEKLLCDKIKQRTGSAGGKCTQLFELFK